MARWIPPPLDRSQALLFSQRLDDAVAQGHHVRVYDAILDAFDWRPWEATYEWFGRPAYHPRDMCKLLIYCYSRGIRSSRNIEDACRNRFDVMWLMAGRTPDHDTIARFRAQHRNEFKLTFRQAVQTAHQVGLADYNLIAIDGTKVQANNARQAASTQAALAQRLAQLDERIERLLRDAEQADHADQTLFGPKGMSAEVKGLKGLKRQQKRLQAALERLQREREQSQDSTDPRRPTTDPDSRIMPGKQGDMQPAYSPQIAVDPSSSIIVAQDVTPDAVDREQLLPMTEQAQANTGHPAPTVLADSNYNSGPNLKACDDKGVAVYMPDAGERFPGRTSADKEIALTPQQQQALHQATGQTAASLPKDASTKRIHRSAFRYEEKQNVYVCPMGRVLRHYATKNLPNDGAKRYGYRCESCAGCGLLGICVKNPLHPRTVSHDSYEPLRQALRERMATRRGKDFYDRRCRVESPFGVIKAVMNVRQFLVRGLDKVKAEWALVCTAYDCKRLANYLIQHPEAWARLGQS